MIGWSSPSPLIDGVPIPALFFQSGPLCGNPATQGAFFVRTPMETTQHLRFYETMMAARGQRILLEYTTNNAEGVHTSMYLGRFLSLEFKIHNHTASATFRMRPGQWKNGMDDAIKARQWHVAWEETGYIEEYALGPFDTVSLLAHQSSLLGVEVGSHVRHTFLLEAEDGTRRLRVTVLM